MVRNYLTTALRNIARHKLYSFINIGGLALGLTCVILIALFIRDETSFDSWVPDSANLYRIDENFTLPGRAPKLRQSTSRSDPLKLPESVRRFTTSRTLTSFKPTWRSWHPYYLQQHATILFTHLESFTIPHSQTQHSGRWCLSRRLEER